MAKKPKNPLEGKSTTPKQPSTPKRQPSKKVNIGSSGGTHKAGNVSSKTNIKTPSFTNVKPKKSAAEEEFKRLHRNATRKAKRIKDKYDIDISDRIPDKQYTDVADMQGKIEQLKKFVDREQTKVVNLETPSGDVKPFMLDELELASEMAEVNRLVNDELWQRVLAEGNYEIIDGDGLNDQDYLDLSIEARANMDKYGPLAQLRNRAETAKTDFMDARSVREYMRQNDNFLSRLSHRNNTLRENFITHVRATFGVYGLESEQIENALRNMQMIDFLTMFYTKQAFDISMYVSPDEIPLDAPESMLSDTTVGRLYASLKTHLHLD